MIAYKEIQDEINDIALALVGVENDNDIVEVHDRLITLRDKIKERNKNQSGKVVAARRKSERARRLHNVDNKLRMARKKGNVEAITKLEEELQYIRENIFD